MTALDHSGEIWCAPNHTVRLGRNWTMGRAENPLIAKDKETQRATMPEALADGHRLSDPQDVCN